MLANVFCWVFAFGILIQRPNNQTELYYNMLFALGFILVGTLSKAVDTYREVHRSKNERRKPKNSENDSESVE